MIQHSNPLTEEEVEGYRERGFLVQEAVFSPAEVEVLKRHAQAEFDLDSPRRTFEEGTDVVRGVHGSHLCDEFFADFVRVPQLLLVARQLLAADVYVHQFKINAKRAFKGEVWEWHQDFIYWHLEDGMPQPEALSAAVFLDDVTEFNGPLIFIPGSQDAGIINVDAREEGWQSTLTADLKYALTSETLQTLANENGLVAPKGVKGSVLWFHCNIAHGSAPNMSPFDRRLLLVTYNNVDNAPAEGAGSRPDWLSNRSSAALEVVDGDPLSRTAVDVGA
ncbi:phytanoyl-CoA dioxygenase family protein [Micromonospora echinofusca]|uniref:Ectoine hydroxylase n=1 Tax=Micromonospora echinofusca TaxID=47858 RepID=A0A1C5G7C4_MICEH|nr:phytanoyl-CoA dioxygenase family protein [Micromonospora echinofusca]SCG15774.1 ectoine hydroxylase [Micromonospora echinofusca]